MSEADYLIMNTNNQKHHVDRKSSQSSGFSNNYNNNHNSSNIAHRQPSPIPMALETEIIPMSNIIVPTKQSSILGASSNLVNSIVGAGIIGIPFALRMSGLWAGTFLLLLVAIMTDKSLRLLIEQAYFHPKLRQLNVRTYEELASYPFGTLGSGFVLSGMFIMAYGAMIAYLLIIKDTIPTILGYEHGTHALERNLILLSTSLVIVVPLSMQRDMASLSFSSAISVAADVVLVVFIAAFSPVKETVEANGGLRQVLANDGINTTTLFIGLGILSTAMACQHSAFIVSNSLSNKTRMRWRWVTNQSIALSAILCLILGISGYLGFLGMTQGDVLNNFEHDSMQANAARLLLAFTMFLTYPMESFVARHVLVMLMHNGDMDAHPLDQGRGRGFTVENEERIEREEFGEGEPNGGANGAVVEGGGILCLNRRQTWTVAIYLSTIMPALVFNDIGPVLSFTGAIGGSCISYIGPGLVFLGVNGEEFISSVGGYLDRWRRRETASIGTSASAVVAAGDLPVHGNASLRIVQQADNRTYESIVSIRKPFWYYLGLFPLWMWIANKGATNMQRKIDSADYTDTSTGDASIDELPRPSTADFLISILFVIFGIVAMVAGVVSNVFVQMNKSDDV